MNDTIDLTSSQINMVRSLLKQYLPNVLVWAYGSRVKWTSRPESDLDIVVFVDANQKAQVSALREAFEESNLPFRVDLFVWDEVPEKFRSTINAEHVVLQEKQKTKAKRFRYEKLANLCISNRGIQTGPFGSQLHKKDYVSNGTPIITVEHLGENRIVHKNLPNVSDSDKERLARYTLRKGDIVFNRVGSVDRRSLVRDKEDGWLFSGRCLRVRVNSNLIDSCYLSYFFGLPMFKEYIRKIAVGATMPSLNTKLLSDVPIFFPPLKEQKNTAHILGTLDDKIELNRQMNETLEAMAQAIFKSWFVDFDPVHAKAEGRQPVGMPPEIAELFPDSFEDSEFGQIPRGWAIVNVGEAVEFAYGKALKADNRKPGIIPVFGSNGQVGWHNQALVEGPGIVIGRKVNPGIITWADSDFFPIDTTFYVVPKRKELSLHYLFHALSYLKLFGLSSDSAVPGLNRNMVYISKILIPNIAIMSAYNNIVSLLSLEIKNNNEESLSLVDIRNTLLPKLISGDVNVSNMERT